MNEFVKKAAQKISKLSDEQIENIFDIINAENESYYSILESLSTGLIIVDRKWKLLQINKSAKRYLPLNSTISEIKADNDELWNYIDDQYISEFLRNAFVTQKTNVSEEFSIASEDKVRFVTVSLSPLITSSINGLGSNVSGEHSGYIISIEDVTEKRQQEILLHRMESLASLTNLAASVAHEIKNPLGAISIHIQLLQKSIAKARERDGMLPDKKFLEDYLSVVNEEIDNLNKIVLDFLFAVRPVQASMILCDPNMLVEKIASFITPEFCSKNIAVETNLCKDPPRLMLDEKLFREVIVNLSQNALAAIQSKFHSENDVVDLCAGTESLDENAAKNSKAKKGLLSFSSFVRNEKYVLLISDNGCGMDSKTASRIFEPYYTTKANGTGLGLTMVYKIIKEFRGDIDVKSVEGKGTVFKILLPVPQKNTRLLSDSSSKKAGK